MSNVRLTPNDTGPVLVPEVAIEDSEPLEFLRELIGDGLQRHDTLYRDASARVVDLLENSIRVGFYLWRHVCIFSSLAH